MTVVLPQSPLDTRQPSLGELMDPLHPLNRGLVGRWLFNEGEGGTVYDSSVWGNHGTWNGTGTHWAAGKFGWAGQFNGSDDYVNVGDKLDPHTGDWSVALWINTTSAGGSAIGLVTKNPHGGTQRWGLYWGEGAAGKLVAFSNIVGVDNKATGPSRADDGNWHLLCATYDRDGNQTAWTDGEAGTPVDISAGDGTDMDIATSLVIGASSGGSIGWYTGFIDDVRIFNRALTPAEIGDLYLLGARAGFHTRTLFPTAAAAGFGGVSRILGGGIAV